MELIQGKEVFQLINKKGPLSEQYSTKILHQLCSAVKYLHERGIAHRDIKTENVMVDCSGQVKLIDFGLAKKFDVGARELLETYCGSASYIAPEMLEKKKY